MDLLVDGKVGLVIVLAALGVADDDVLDAGLLEHLGGDLTGVGAVGLIVAGLSADGDTWQSLKRRTALGCSHSGTHSTTSHHLPRGMMGLSSSAKALVSDRVLFIFQLPAMMVLR